MQPIVNIAIKAARKAGDFILRYQHRLDTLKISEKGNNDFVTEADVGAEQIIIETIRENYPEHSILGEESGLIPGKDTNTTWIIDPLDGTTNFMHGIPIYSVVIALKQGKHIEHAVVYDPVRQEIFSASRGRGARVEQQRTRVSSQANIDCAILATGGRTNNPPGYATLRRLGSAALALAYVASGRIDGYWEYGLQPWDIAAGSLLVKESGGLIIDTDSSENYLDSGNVVAGNPKIVKALITAVS